MPEWILEALSAALVFVLITFLTVAVPALWGAFRRYAVTTASLWDDRFVQIVDAAIVSAEQKGVAGEIENVGQTKKDEAVRIVSRRLNALPGFRNVDLAVIADAIESRVRRAASEYFDQWEDE